ncbi:hypothetical protein FQN49_004529 [Arthroderma sp. PD_2]|nr:hypothetical protein FQN49_004529 [Arthroderma sp. PD_2]
MFIAGLLLKGIKSRYSTGSIFGTLVECSIRFLQFVFGIAVIGLYAQDVDRARKNGDTQDSRWIFATVVGTLSAISGLIYILIPCAVQRPLSQATFIHLPCFIYDSVLVILWLTQFGIFAKLYITVDDEKDTSLKRMKHSAYVDLVNLSFWMITCAWCGIRWWRGNKAGAVQGNEKEFAEEQHIEHV